MPDETLAERLKRLRKKAGFTQAELAYQIGVHEMTVRRWEKGVRPLTDLTIIKKLAEILNISEEELLHGTPKKATWVFNIEVHIK